MSKLNWCWRPVVFSCIFHKKQKNFLRWRKNPEAFFQPADATQQQVREGGMIWYSTESDGWSYHSVSLNELSAGNQATLISNTFQLSVSQPTIIQNDEILARRCVRLSPHLNFTIMNVHRMTSAWCNLLSAARNAAQAEQKMPSWFFNAERQLCKNVTQKKLRDTYLMSSSFSAQHETLKENRLGQINMSTNHLLSVVLVQVKKQRLKKKEEIIKIWLKEENYCDVWRKYTNLILFLNIKDNKRSKKVQIPDEPPIITTWLSFKIKTVLIFNLS